jgi:hypothetical protein
MALASIIWCCPFPNHAHHTCHVHTKRREVSLTPQTTIPLEVEGHVVLGSLFVLVVGRGIRVGVLGIMIQWYIRHEERDIIIWTKNFRNNQHGLTGMIKGKSYCFVHQSSQNPRSLAFVSCRVEASATTQTIRATSGQISHVLSQCRVNLHRDSVLVFIFVRVPYSSAFLMRRPNSIFLNTVHPNFSL